MKPRPLYNCTVRLNGSRDNTVNVVDVTAAEIKVLQFIHSRGENGAEPVIDVVPTGKGVVRADGVERDRLTAKYPGVGELRGERFIASLFGVNAPLPFEYEAPREQGEPAAEHGAEPEVIVNLAPEGQIISTAPATETPPDAPRRRKSVVLDEPAAGAAA